jgi:hypothetical protein
MWGSMPLKIRSTTVITIFTLCKGCTHSHELWFHHSSATRKSPFYQICTSFCVWPRDHYKTFQWFWLPRNVHTEVSPPVWASQPTRNPLLCLMGFGHRSFTHTFPRFNQRSFTEHPSSFAITASPHIWFVREDQPLPHTMPGHSHIGSRLYCFHGWSLHEPILRFGYDKKPKGSSIALDKALNY